MIDLYHLKVLPGETANPHRKAFIASPEAGSRFVYQRSLVNPASCSASAALIRKSSFPASESFSSCLSQRACSNSINQSRSFEIEELNRLPKLVHSGDWPLKRVQCTISCGGTSWVVIYGCSRRGLGLSGWLRRWGEFDCECDNACHQSSSAELLRQQPAIAPQWCPPTNQHHIPNVSTIHH